MMVKERIEENPLLDVAVLTHGFAPYMRDYDVLIEAMWGEKEWQKNGEPEGYVWGVSWSMAYLGLRYIENSQPAAKWSERFGKEMHEAVLETNAFILRLVFHDFSIDRLSDEVGIIDKVLIPLKNF